MHLFTVLLPGVLQLMGSLFEKYVFSDWNFIGYLMVLVIIDTCTGVYAAWRTDWIVSFRLRSVCEKIWYYFIALVVVHIVAAHQVDGETNKFFELAVPMFKGSMYFVLLASEVLSIDENASKVGRGFLPAGIRVKIKKIKESGMLPVKEKENEKEQLA